MRVTRVYEVTGEPEQLDILERILGRMEYLGNLGASRTISVYVDGDGKARIKVKRNGKLLPYMDYRSKKNANAHITTLPNGNVEADLG